MPLSKKVAGAAMKRREFIKLFGPAAIAWPLAARAQQQEQMRRIGALLPATADDAVFQARLGVFLQELAILGWAIGRNMRIDVRWASADAGEIRRHAAELVALKPDVILATGDSTMPPLLQATRTVPIVFPTGLDPVANGYVSSLSRPGGNATGFMIAEYTVGGKWLELLKEIAKRHPGGGYSGCDQPFRDRSVRRHQCNGTLTESRGHPGQYGQRRRDRA